MEAMKQQIEQCLLDSIGNSHHWKKKKLKKLYKMYNIFTANKSEDKKQITPIKEKQNVNSMKKR